MTTTLPSPTPLHGWQQRVDPARIEAAVGRLRAQGWLDDAAPAVLVHDLDLLEARASQLGPVFGAHALHAAAIKANPLPAILETAVQAGLGLEAASWGEVELALAAGCDPARIVYDSPAKTRHELALALRQGIRINADNLDELARLAELAPPPEAAIGLRLNPVLGHGTIAITSVSDRHSRFGVPWPGEPAPLIEPFERHPWLSGLHVHVGSQGCSIAMLVEGVQRVLALRDAIDARLGAGRIRWIDIGGGLPNDYGAVPDGPTPRAPIPTLAEYVEALRAQAPALWSGEFGVVTEFGRALQVGCGFAVSRVEYVKRVGERQLATIHLGADLLLRTAYAPDDWPHELLVLDAEGRRKSGPDSPWTIVGPLCFAGDVIARDRPLPAIAEGDHLVIRDTGGYTLSMWSRYCSRALPPVVGLRGRAPALSVLRARESAADVVRFWRGTS